MAKLLGRTGGDVILDGGVEPEQLSLLVDDVPVRVTPGLVQKATPVVHIYPVNGSYNLFCRRVFNALLDLSLRVWRQMTDEAKTKVLQERRVLRFSSTVSEISTVLELNSKATDRIYEAVDRLYKLEFKFDVMVDYGENWKVNSRLVSQWARPEKGTGEIQWEYLPDVFALLMQPKSYASIEMRLVNRLSSTYSLALYENTYRYVGNPSQKTARLSVLEWIRLIVTSPAADGFAEPGRYRYFKRDILIPAINELSSNDICPVDIELIETKGAKGRVTHIQFKVELKKQMALPTETGQTGDPRIESAMRRYGVADATISKFLVSYDDSELLKFIQQFEERLAKGGVRNPAGAFVDLVTKNYHGIPLNRGSAEDRPDIPQIEAVHSPEEDKKRWHEMFSKHRFDRARTFFDACTLEAQAALREQFLRDPMATDVIRKQVHKAGYTSPMVLGVFNAWLMKQPGVLVNPEDESPAAFKEYWLALREGQERLEEAATEVLTSKSAKPLVAHTPAKTAVAKKTPRKRGGEKQSD